MRKVLCFILLIGMVTIGATALAADSDAQKIEICKACIGTIMGKDPIIMSGAIYKGEIPVVYYNRPSDGSLWSYKCKIKIKTITWAMADGRWRYEDFISYEIKDNQITIVDKTAGVKKSFPFNP